MWTDRPGKILFFSRDHALPTTPTDMADTSFQALICAVEAAKRLPGGPCGAAAQRDVYVVTMERILSYVVNPYYNTVVTSLADVRPYFMDPKLMIAKVLTERLTRRSSHGIVGDNTSPNTVAQRLNAIIYVIRHWPALNLPVEIRDEYFAAFTAAKAAAAAAALAAPAPA